MDKDVDMMFVSQFSHEVMDIIKDARQALTDAEYSKFIKSCKRLIDEMDIVQLNRHQYNKLQNRSE